MEGFFSVSEITSRKREGSLIPKCGACKLYQSCQSPKMPVRGLGRKKILIVGEAPGADEDRRNEQFVGVSGQLLEKSLRKFGVDMRKDCWTTNSLICRPPHNATPTKNQIEWCRPNLIKTINELKPVTVILLGTAAVQALIPWLWKDKEKPSITQWAGWQVPCQRINAWVCPSYHPSFVLRAKEEPQKAILVPDLFESHLSSALKKTKRPWNPLPDFQSQVEPILKPSEAAVILREMTRKRGAVAIDYETTGLKPDNEGMEIYTCGVCWRGRRTIAYPWRGEAIEATYELLRSRLPKIAANFAFEERWTLAEFGVGVRNWEWDTMIDAHVIDNRQGITSVKFQSFALLGQEDYDSHIKPYLESPSSNTPNRIKELKLRDVLIYNGMDALLEYKIAEIQRRKLRFPAL